MFHMLSVLFSWLNTEILAVSSYSGMKFLFWLWLLEHRVNILLIFVSSVFHILMRQACRESSLQTEGEEAKISNMTWIRQLQYLPCKIIKDSFSLIHHLTWLMLFLDFNSKQEKAIWNYFCFLILCFIYLSNKKHSIHTGKTSLNKYKIYLLD